MARKTLNGLPPARETPRDAAIHLLGRNQRASPFVSGASTFLVVISRARVKQKVLLGERVLLGDRHPWCATRRYVPKLQEFVPPLPPK
jgi:hypothetical protein